jgi:hypothetical protein
MPDLTLARGRVEKCHSRDHFMRLSGKISQKFGGLIRILGLSKQTAVQHDDRVGSKNQIG